MESNHVDSRYSAAFILAAVGDALGWPHENRSNSTNKLVNDKYGVFQDWSRCAGGRYWQHREDIKKGEYSDDTQLIIATARSLLHKKDWAASFCNTELPFWLEYERGGGKATKTAAKFLKKGKKPWMTTGRELESYFNAGGNGVAMRILPHVIFEQHNIKNIMGKVVINGIYTHGHPRALLGATCYAYALEILSQKQNVLKYGELVDKLIEEKEIWSRFPSIDGIDEWKKQFEKVHKAQFSVVWEENADIVIKGLEKIKKNLKKGVLDVTQNSLQELGVFDKKIGGAGDITTIAAIYLASKYATNPQKAILEAAYLKGADTDTIASMTGALLGMLYGEEIIPLEWCVVQDYAYLKKLPQYLLNPSLYWEEEERKEYKYINLSIGKAKESFSEVNRKNNTKEIIIKKYETIHGQTIYIKQLKKIKMENQENIIQDEKIKNELFHIKELEHLNLKQYIDCLYEISNHLDEEKIINKYNIKKDTIQKIRRVIH